MELDEVEYLQHWVRPRSTRPGVTVAAVRALLEIVEQKQQVIRDFQDSRRYAAALQERRLEAAYKRGYSDAQRGIDPLVG